MHTFKFMSTLQEDQAGDNPVIVRIETKAGHGGGKPTSKGDRGGCRYLVVCDV